MPAEPVLDRPALSASEVNLSNVYQLVMRDLLNPDLLQLGIDTQRCGKYLGKYSSIFFKLHLLPLRTMLCL